MHLLTIATAAIFTGAFAWAPPQGLVSTLTAAPEGGWTWFNEPRAISRGGVTYFGYTRGSDGAVLAASLDEATMELETFTLHAALEIDDHTDPAFVFLPDGRMMALYAKHSTDGSLRYRITTAAGDISAWAAEATVPSLPAGIVTYAVPVWLPGDDLRVYYRMLAGGDFDWYMSSWDGSTWAAGVAVAEPRYIKVAYTDTAIHFIASEHPADAQTSLYHFYWEDGAYHQSDGTVITGGLPITTDRMTLVYDGSTEEAWMMDVAMNGDLPMVVFSSYPGNDGSEHIYRLAEWDGDSWDLQSLGSAGADIHPGTISGNGEPFYSGGAAIADPDLLYLSRQSGVGQWSMSRLARVGGEWQEKVLTSGSKDIRPARVVDGTRLRALWLRGAYTTYLDYSVGVMAGY